jgi:serine/threonine-protein kinase
VALVTEYLEGLDVARCVKPSTRLPPKVLLGVVGEVASALHNAFNTLSPETGKPLALIHRDIKPDNIRIGNYGEVKVLDFGIARTTEMFRHAKTAQGALPFTPGYAPPEAFTKGFQGSSSDIFALGVTLFRLLEAKKFFEGLDITGQVTICCLAERYDPFLEKRLRVLETGGPIKSVVRDMLRYEPSERPTAEEVAERCRALAADLDGPDLVTWARAMTFPPPKSVEGASLTGMTLQEDKFDSRTAKRSKNPRDEWRRSNRADQLPRDPSAASLDPLPAPATDPAPAPAPAPAPTKEATPAGKKTLDVLFDGPPAVPNALGNRSLTPAPVVRDAPAPVKESGSWVPIVVVGSVAALLLGGGLMLVVGLFIGIAAVSW